jgi:arginine exporter protein ArgO
LSLGLAFDDLWLIHESYPMWLGLDELSLPIPFIRQQDFFESLVFGLYGAIVAAYLYYFRKIFKQTPMSALLVAIACFALSIVVDVLGIRFGIRNHHISEEIFKILGIVGWLFYFSLTCRQALQYSGRLLTQTSNSHKPHPSRTVNN